MTRALAVLRPEPGNAATRARIAALGLVAIRLPLFAVHPLAWAPPDPTRFDALLLTSANAVRHAGAGLDVLRALPVVAVGAATAKAARAAGLHVAHVGDADADAAVRAFGGGRLLHLGGRERSDVRVEGRAVYAADALPIDSAAILGGSVALLHSARAARRLRDLVARDGIADLRIAAISAAVRDAAPPFAGAVADRPDDATLVALAARLAAD